MGRSLRALSEMTKEELINFALYTAEGNKELIDSLKSQGFDTSALELQLIQGRATEKIVKHLVPEYKQNG